MKDFRPLNPWGRAMPKAPPAHPPLCQLYVHSREKKCDLRVGPRMPFEQLEPLMMQINASAGLGVETDWCEARIVTLSKPKPKTRLSGLTVADVLANPSLLKV